MTTMDKLKDDEIKDCIQKGMQFTTPKSANVEFVQNTDEHMIIRKGKKAERTGRIMVWEDYIKYLRKHNYYFI